MADSLKFLKGRKKLLMAAISLIGLLAAPVPLLAQTGPKGDDEIVQSFLADKARGRGNTDATHQKRGKGASASEMRRMVKALSFEKPAPFDKLPATSSDALSESLAFDAADYLISVGWEPNDIRAMTRSGFDPLTAAIRLIRGSSTQDDRIMLSPIIVIGEIKSVSNEDLSDGFGSTVSFQAKSVIASPRGKPLPPTLLIRQKSGLMTGRGREVIGSDFGEADIGRTYMLLLSDDRYQQSSGEGGKQGKGGSPDALFVVLSAFDAITVDASGTGFEKPLDNGMTSAEQLRARVGQLRK